MNWEACSDHGLGKVPYFKGFVLRSGMVSEPIQMDRGAVLLMAFVSQPLKTLTVPWTIETATTAARRATPSLLRITRLPSPTPPCTSSPCRPACSSRASCGISATTPCRATTWIIGNVRPSGGCCFQNNSNCLFFH